MSNGYLVATAADAAVAREIGDGFGLEVIEAGAIGDVGGVAAALADAANVGLLLSNAAAADTRFVALMRTLAQRLARAQLIVVDAEARAAFAFLPQAWPVMSLDDARTRANALARQREPASEEPPRAHPLPPTPPEAPVEERAEEPATESSAAEEQPAPETASVDQDVEEQQPPAAADDQAEGGEDVGAAARQNEDESAFEAPADEPTPAEPEQSVEAEAPATLDEAPIPAAPPSVEPLAPPPQAPAPPAQVDESAHASDGDAWQPQVPRKRGEPVGAATSSAPADATAFAPKKLRRGTPELVRIVVHQPKDLQAVIKAAKKLDPRTDPAPQGMPLGEVALGASIGIALDVRGGACDGALQRRAWAGEPIDFAFSVEADEDVKQVVFLARVFVDDAQIGVLAFTRNVAGPAKKPHSPGDRVRLKRHKRVFLSYSSKDRETVSAIATAYQSAGVEHFWDRTSLKSGEEWHPRLRREIDRADLFHLCWSRAAADSEWVKKEAEHALTRRRRNSGRPDITVQMLDGPPWAAHPSELDAINFDDFVRAAIVGYARGDGSQ